MATQNFIHGFWGTEAPIKLYSQESHLAADAKTILKYLGGEYTHVSFLKQVHGASCLEIGSGSDISYAHEADAQVTQHPKIILALRTADCVPVLLADPVHRVVGIAHAGWRGGIGGVIEGVVKKMERAGANTKHIIALIGPCIRQDCYEVSPDFVSRFLLEDVNNSKFFKQSSHDKHKHFFDLPGCITELLHSVGVHHVHDTGIDTFKDSKFFSYRRAKQAGLELTEHNLSFIALQNDR